jgi:hypothetical protein
LRAYAAGLYCAEAAVELLIGHAVWLRRSDFVGEFIESGRDMAGGVAMAFIDWVEVAAAVRARRLPCSGSEGQILRIAASIGEGVPVDLGEALTGLDGVNVVLVARAVLHAGGHREITIDLAGVALR